MRRFEADDTFYQSMIETKLKYKFQFVWKRRPELEYSEHMSTSAILGDIHLAIPIVDIATHKLAADIDIALKDGSILDNVSESPL